ncbi:MAG: DEAD/DEAH box helicase [Bacteroidota bacterium]|nr:DEAD/DEAH box helicase [Bacteroidota bacterium]
MFKEKFHKKLAANLLLNGYEEPTELQSKAITKINGGFDVIGVGPANIGKTTLIAMMTVQKLQRAIEDAPRALILVSDMEKAIALKEQFLLFTKDTDLRTYCVYEEGKINKEAEEIYVGTDILIGTPKRILDLYFIRNLNLNKIKLFAIDDAEMMLKIAAQGHIDRLALSLPKCQHLVFTDGLNEKIEKLIHKFIIAPHIIEVTEERH